MIVSLSGNGSIILSDHSSPEDVIHKMGGEPTNRWNDGVEECLIYEFPSHDITFTFGATSTPKLLSVDISLTQLNPLTLDRKTVREISSHRGSWKAPKNDRT